MYENIGRNHSKGASGLRDWQVIHQDDLIQGCKEAANSDKLDVTNHKVS